VESHPKQRNPVQERHGDWTHAMQLEARPVGFPDSVRAMGVAPLTVGSDLKGVTPWIREAAIKEPVNVLALSGGGAGAAFGTGALVGWTRAGTRPEFQVVTGVSVGAPVAPFAFLGSAWDDKLREAFSGGRTEHLLRRRWSGALFGSSLYRGQPLASLVDSCITIEMVRAIGVEADKGRLLLVATTKLDTEQTVVWNLTAIAAQGTEAARELIRDVLIAAASVPGAFPPVMIHVESLGRRFDEIHVDGAATTTLLTGTEIPGFLPRSVDALLGARLCSISPRVAERRANFGRHRSRYRNAPRRRTSDQPVMGLNAHRKMCDGTRGPDK
jgi:hypothetical protein